MSSQNEHNEHGVNREHNPGGDGQIECRPVVALPADVRFFRRTRIDRIRRFGEVERFPDGEILFQAGKLVAGMYVILPGRVAITPRDGLGTAVPVAKFAELIGAYLK